MEDIQQLVNNNRAKTILQDIQQWHDEYIRFHNIESEEMRKKILQLKLKNVSFNLKQNPELLGNLARLLPHEMNPKRWEEMMQLQQTQNSKKQEVVETDMFQCSRCGSKKCSYTECFLRSGDEASVLFITCLNCAKRWKQ